MNGKKLTRKQIAEGLDSVPMETILLGAASGGTLTPKQREFARNLALGKSKAQSYREAYDTKGSNKTQAQDGWKLSKRPEVDQMREAYSLAIEAAKHRTPAQLRELVIHRLTSLAINEEVNPAQQIQALKLLGQVSEVAAFTERKEVHTIKHSEDIRGRLVEQLRALTSNAIDITPNAAKTQDADLAADSLLAELAGDGLANSPEPDPTAPPPPEIDPLAIENTSHTIPRTQSAEKSMTTPTYEDAHDVTAFCEVNEISDLEVSPVQLQVRKCTEEVGEGVEKCPGDAESVDMGTPPASSENEKG